MNRWNATNEVRSQPLADGRAAPSEGQRRWRRCSAAGYGSLGLAALAIAGCGADSTDVIAPGAGAPGMTSPDVTAPDPGAPGSDPAPAGGSAVMVVGQVYSPEAYNTYVGVFPQVPDGDISFANFREFGNANAYSSNGYIFVEEEGVMQRFSVDEDLQLVDGPRFSWQDFGISSINASYTVFATAERAYTFAPELDVVIVWDPEAMVRVGTLPINFPERPVGMETFAYDGHLVGNRVIWNVFSGDFEAITSHPGVVLAMLEVGNDEAPVRLIEDDRCLPGGPGRVDENGDFYVHGAGYYGYFLAYGGVPDARTCILRVRAGEDGFDPEFMLDYQALTGSYVSDPWFHVTGGQYVSRSWTPDVPYPENPDEFWDNEALQPLLVDTGAGMSLPYPDLDAGKGVDGATRKVDGISYYQLSDTGYVENGDTEVVELHPDGIRPKFHLNGFLIGLERVR